MAKVGFIGLGVMGARMAGHLVKAGHDVTVWNRTPSRAEPLRELGASVAVGPREVALVAEFVCICVSKNEDVEAVVSQFPSELNEKLVIDHSTIAPTKAIEICEVITTKGGSFIDAPVTGGERGAIEGTLTIFCGGSEANVERAQPILSAYGRKVERVGDVGSGQKMKMANQIAVGISVLALCEALVFAENAGLGLQQTLDLVGSGAGGSWSFTNYGPKILNRDWTPGFSVALQQKDLMYALQSARESGASLPGAALVHQLLAALENNGRGADATPALFEVIEQMSSKTAKR
ncbi:MAG: NAD(P)-dependent oxidoreductase [Fimbriimonadales bacterium]